MENIEKTKSQLISENEELRDKVEELEISQRNSELLERALLEGEHHYRSLYQNAPLGYQSLDERGNIIEVNEAWCNSLGYEREEVIGMSFIGYLTDKYQNKFKQRFSELISKGQMFSEEYEMIKKDGSRVTMSFEDKAAYTIDGEFKQSHSILYNMTAQRQMERALRESEEKYRNLIYYINDAIYETDESFIIRFISPAIDYIFGYKPEDVAGKSLENFIYTDDLELYKERFKIAASGIGGRFECRIKTKSGELCWINLSYKPILLDEKFVGMRGVISDINERKRTEDKLYEAQAKYKEIFEGSRDGYVMVDSSGQLIDANRAYCHMLGYKIDELKELKDFYEITPEKWRKWEKEEIWENRLLKRGYSGIYEKEYIRKDGSVFPVELQSSCVFSNDKKPLYLWGVVRDITEKKRLDDIQLVLYDIASAVNTTKDHNELFLSIRKYLSKVVDTTNFIIALHDKETDTISLPFMVDKEDKFTSFPAGKTLIAYVIKTGKALLATEKDIERLINSGEVETIGTHSKVWLGVPLKLEGKVMGVIAIQSYTDPNIYTEKDVEVLEFVSEEIALAIERKRAEEALQKKERRLKNAQELAKVGDYEWELATNKINWSDGLYKIFGLPFGTQLNYENLSKCIHPDDLEYNTKMMNEWLKEGGGKPYEYRIILQDGTLKYLYEECDVIYDNKGKPEKIFGVIHDITERKQTEEALKEQKSLLDNILSASSVGLSHVVDRKIIWANETMEELFDIPKEKYQGQNTRMLYQSDEEYHRVGKILYEQIQKNQKAQLDAEFVRGDGSIFYGHAKVSNLDFENPRKGIIVSIIDITERKLAEKAIQDREERMRNILDNIPDMVLQVDANMKILWANKSSIEKKPNAIGKPCYKAYQGRNAVCHDCPCYKAIKTGQIESGTVQFPTKKNTEESYRENIGVPLKDSKGKVTGVIEISRDVTVQRKTEAEKQKLLKDVQERVKELQCMYDLNMIANNKNSTVAEILHSTTKLIPRAMQYPEITCCRIVFDNKTFKSKNFRKSKWILSSDIYINKNKKGTIDVCYLKTKPDVFDGPFMKEERQLVDSISQRISEIIDRKGIDEALKQAEENYRSIFENAVEGIYQSTPDGKFINVNPSLARMLGYKSPENLIKEVTNIGTQLYVDQEQRKKFEKLIEKRGVVRDFEIQLNHKSGKKMWAALASRTVRDKKGKIKYYEGTFEDITEAKLAEERLRNSEELNRAINERSPLGISVRSNTGQLLGYNESWKKIWAKPQREIDEERRQKRKKLTYTEADDYLREWQTQVKNAYETGGTLYIPELKTNVRRKNAAKWVSQYFYAIKDESGKVNRVVILTEDISERKITEKRLKESEERFRSVFENNPTGIYRSTPDGSILMANPALMKMLGYSSVEEMSRINLEKQEFDKKFPRDKFKKKIEEEGVIIDYESKWKKTDGTWIDVKENAKVVRDDDGKIKYYEGTAEDIMKRLLADKELRNSREQLMNLSSHLQTIREEERASMSREIHDDLGQSLTAIKMDVTWLDRNLYKDRDESNRKIQAMKGLIDATIDSVQRISSELRPAILDDLGISTAIQWQAEEFSQRSGIKCKVKLKPKEIKLDEKLSIAIYRIFQESLTNVARHARASKVEISFKTDNNGVELFIKDNGIGIDASKINDPKSLGLIGMQERVYPWKGIIEIKGKKGKGTTIKVNISLKNK